MSKIESKGAKIADAYRRRPSIEESPTLQKPVYIISKNMNSQHILQLTEAFDKQKIAYQMQQETSTLGFKLNQRFFVIVDNKFGEVTLGPQFGSIVMTIVGYPRLGKNKKNKYFQTPAQVIAFYQHFKNGNDISDRQKSLIQSQYSDVILENVQTNCKINSKIMMRSISKYKGQQKSLLKDKVGNDKDKQQTAVKLIILEDKSDVTYSNLCDQLLNERNDRIERAEGMQSVRKKTLFHTNKTQIYYLVNYKQEKDLVKNIFIGEVIVFQEKLKKNALNTIVNQPKIYAIACDTNQTFKILEKIGVLRNDQSKLECSKIKEEKEEAIIPAVETVKKKEQSVLQRQTKQVQQKGKQIQQKIKQQQKRVDVIEVQQLSKIEGNHSQISHLQQPSQLDTSIISQASSKSRKVKKLKKQAKITNTVQNESEYYDTSKKQNQNHKVEGGLLKKRLLTKQSMDIMLKSKKSLTFFDDVKRNSQQVKRVKSISKCQPLSVCVQMENNATMTQDQYFPVKIHKKSRDLTATIMNNELLKSSFSNFSKLQRDNGWINAVFYREFIPKFVKIIDAIKTQPSSIFSENSKMQIYQPFLNSKQFDRLARKIKRKLKQKGHTGEQYKFVVFLLKEELAEFQKYCFDKNNLYEIEENDMASTFKSNMSSMLSNGFSRISMCVFTDCELNGKMEVSDFCRIKLFKYSLPNLFQNVNLSKLLQWVRERLIECKMIQNVSEYMRS